MRTSSLKKSSDQSGIAWDQGRRERCLAVGCLLEEMAVLLDAGMKVISLMSPSPVSWPYGTPY